MTAVEKRLFVPNTIERNENELVLVRLSVMPRFNITDYKKFYGTAFISGTAMIPAFPLNDEALNAPCQFYSGKMVRQTHVAFFGLETVSIMKLKEFQKPNPNLEPWRRSSPMWYAKQKFATKTTLEPCWYLALKDIVPGSDKYKTFEEQKAMLPQGYEVTTAVEETAKNIFLYEKTGIYPNPHRYARVADTDSHGYRLFVGHCNEDGVEINNRWFDCRLGHIGIGAIRRL
jgi:hypothetical protein